MAFTEQGDIVVFTREVYAFAQNNEFKPAPIPVPDQVYVKEFAKTGKWKWWDATPDTLDTNLYPEKIKNALAGCPAAGIALETLCVYTYGKGLGVFKKFTKDGKEAVEPVFSEKHMEYFIANNITDYCIKSITDYWTFANSFTQLIKNKAGDKFAAIANIDAPFCRLGYQSEETGFIEKVYVHGNWRLPVGENDCTVYPLLNRFNYTKQLEQNKTAPTWVYQAYSYSPGVVYYHKHPWHAALDTGVFDLAPEIPKIRKSRFKNALFIKYHVEIEESYWKIVAGEKKYAELQSKPEELRQLRNTVYTQIDKMLGGTDNAFKSLFSGKITDSRTGNTTNLIKITKIETDYGDSAAFDPDKMSNTADIFLAFGIPAPIMNTVLSDAKSRGGGSDVREGILALQQRLKLHRDNILAPLTFAMRFNNLLAWDEFLAFEDMIPTTLDVNPTGTQKTVAA